ncbi:response regulator [Lapillicoccus jejuensis]|uniref:Two-component system chemotaxis response regulator CheY n=1 Tax=Lapillicoccus jejuensis TaxID=402171 RepID=A0A542E1A4_9MICO|nr:response regulator [Lapillicoccus jejuensis]TQJ09118.1 two-component system chemotaxis response regulator CheY [Lapillicoccus jejuensis]
MKALIVDDSRAMRLVVARIVQRLGFETVQAEHGQAALDVLAGSDELPDVALVDWNMPVMDGLELIKAVRAQPRYRGITLMMVTTESEQSRIVQALAAGAHEYLIKPFTEEALEDKLSLLGLVPATADAEAVAW